MAVKKTKNGRWQAVIAYRDDFGQPRNKRKIFDLKRDAQNFENEFRRSLGSPVDESVTFDAVYEDYIKSISVNANKETIQQKHRLTDTFLYDLKGRKMNMISKKLYFDIWHEIANSDYSYSYKKKIIAQMKAIANFAYLYYNIEDNTKALSNLKKPLDDHEEMQVWNEKEFKEFIEQVDNETYQVFFWVLYYTGMRRGEALALQKSDLKGDSLSISKAMKHYKNGFTPLKTSSSKRKIRLDKVTLNKVKGIMGSEGNFLFGGLRPLSVSSIQRTFTEAKKDAGVTDIRLHDLRHSHASMLINKGANIVAVSQRLGHSNTQTTLRVYTHLLEDTADELMDILNR